MSAGAYLGCAPRARRRSVRPDRINPTWMIQQQALVDVSVQRSRVRGVRLAAWAARCHDPKTQQHRNEAARSGSPARATLINLYPWCRHQESNPGPTDYKSVALPTELCRRGGGF